VCATSRRNNLNIALEHCTSCASLHPRQGPRPSGTVLPLKRKKTQEKIPRTECYIAAASTRFVFGRTTLARHVLHSFWGGWFGCCATLRLRRQNIVAGLFSCGAFAVFVFVLSKSLFGSFLLGRITDLQSLQATTTRFPTRVARRTRASSSRRAVRCCPRWFRRVLQNRWPITIDDGAVCKCVDIALQVG